MGVDLRQRPDHRDRHPGSPAPPLHDDQYPRGELPAQRAQESRPAAADLPGHRAKPVDALTARRPDGQEVTSNACGAGEFSTGTMRRFKPALTTFCLSMWSLLASRLPGVLLFATNLLEQGIGVRPGPS